MSYNSKTYLRNSCVQTFLACVRVCKIWVHKHTLEFSKYEVADLQMAMNSPLALFAVQGFYAICSWWVCPFHLKWVEKYENSRKYILHLGGIFLSNAIRNCVCLTSMEILE